MSTNLWTNISNPSFRTRATAIAIAVGITPILAIGTINYLQVRQTSEQQEAGVQKARAQTLADKLNRFIFERYGDVEILASLPVFADAKVTAVASDATKTKVLNKFISSYQVYDSIAIFDLNGNPIAQSQGDKLDNHADRSYFQEVLKTGKTVISDPSISKSSGKLVLHFAAPIRDLVTDRIIGVARTRTPIDRLASPLQDFASKTENFYIINRKTNKIFMSSNDAYKNRLETPEMAQARSQPGLIPFQRTDTGNRVELLSAAPFTKLKGLPELPWTAVVAIDDDTAFIEVKGLLLTILAGTGVMVGVAIGLSTLVSDRVARYIKRAIETISNSTSEIVDTVQTQEIAVNQQANSAIATTDSVNELESISTETAQQAASSATGARQALSLAEEGTQSVQRTIREMSELRDRVDEIAIQIINLGEQTGQITNISNLVSDLAKQTNMLALKAAVEAARAGEQGKGFGVVAGEIRKLADESKKSAQKINNLATDIQTAIDRTVAVTDLGTKTATEGIQVAEQTATTFIGVTDAVSNVFLSSQQISASVTRQATAIQQVLDAMTIISQGSQESAVGMHKVKTFTNELNQVADELQAAVS
ncbi:methyl-accepting chemotaxis protein [Chamaesiphon sp. GL140_3_metabinner_50]|uniref:methyl-accepting chemotaxis protein n=1 Tax=Chamaesiphon sp. GL140_3_metabinner_50 TaxID=2970812 RepID=UPI0025DC1AE2|nr:methyl-accepting chemotaxis protein [Chamaesiphon sp. GL140_3_metabinner_50]